MCETVHHRPTVVSLPTFTSQLSTVVIYKRPLSQHQLVQ